MNEAGTDSVVTAGIENPFLQRFHKHRDAPGSTSSPAASSDHTARRDPPANLRASGHPVRRQDHSSHDKCESRGIAAGSSFMSQRWLDVKGERPSHD